MPAEQQSHFPETLQTENRLPTWSKLLLINTEELIFSLTMQADTQKRSTMIKQGKGDIVNVSSRMGRIASQMGAYAVAKGGIVTMTKTTAIQTKEYGIKCNAVSPGIVDTPGQRVYNHSVGQDGCPMGSSKDVAKADSPAVMTGQAIDLFTTV